MFVTLFSTLTHIRGKRLPSAPRADILPAPCPETIFIFRVVFIMNLFTLLIDFRTPLDNRHQGGTMNKPSMRYVYKEGEDRVDQQ